MSGKLSPEQMAATMEILWDDARLARALTGHIEALEAEIKALRAEIEWPTFREAVAATELGQNIAKTMLRMCQEAVAKREASA